MIAEPYDYDWPTAEQEFRRAIELDPQYATAHQWYAEGLSLQGHFAEALAESDKARQLEPMSVIITGDCAAILYFARRYSEAIAEFRTAQGMQPGLGRNAHDHLRPGRTRPI